MIPIAMGLLKPIGISINPMIASVAMVFSSITVILNASRLKSIKFDWTSEQGDEQGDGLFVHFSFIVLCILILESIFLMYKITLFT